MPCWEPKEAETGAVGSSRLPGREQEVSGAFSVSAHCACQSFRFTLTVGVPRLPRALVSLG